MNELKIFEFQQKKVRTEIVNNNPYFCGKDVCEILGYLNFRDALLRHCKGVVKHDSPTESGNQEMSFIPESDIYRLVMRSKLPSAEIFQDWVVKEVLPSIRKTGSYQRELSLEEMTLKVIYGYQDKVKVLEEKIKEDHPKVDFYNRVADTTDTYDMLTAAKLLNCPGIGRTYLYAYLRSRSLLTEKNLPLQRYINEGLFKVKLRDGETFSDEVKTEAVMFVTKKGLEYIGNLLKRSRAW